MAGHLHAHNRLHILSFTSSDHVVHVRTQIPYALIGAGVAVGLYLLVA